MMYWSWERGTKILYNCSTFSINIEKSATDGESQPVWLLPLLLPKYKHTGVAHQCTTITTKVLRCPTVCSSHPLRLVLYYTNQQQFIYNKQILDVIAVFSLLFLLLRTYVVVALAIWWRRLMWQWRTLCVFILSFRSFFLPNSRYLSMLIYELKLLLEWVKKRKILDTHEGLEMIYYTGFFHYMKIYYFVYILHFLSHVKEVK